MFMLLLPHNLLQLFRSLDKQKRRKKKEKFQWRLLLVYPGAVVENYCIKNIFVWLSIYKGLTYLNSKSKQLDMGPKNFFCKLKQDWTSFILKSGLLISQYKTAHKKDDQ